LPCWHFPLDRDHGRIPVSLSGLPERWAVATLEDVSHPKRVIQYGILKPGPHIDGGIPYVKVMNIKGGRVELERIRRTTAEIAHQYRRASILPGDILLTIRGTVGRLAIVPRELDGGNITQDTVRIAVLGVEQEFVFWYLHCPAVQQYFARNQKGVAVRGINVGDVRPLEVPLPTRDEQREIVKKNAAAFSWINRLSSESLSARKLIDNLEQAILAKAFQGELVPQDPNDESASVLLDRIRTENATAEPARSMLVPKGVITKPHQKVSRRKTVAS
jgi:type I restriction enzyme S subunit